jgi:hypothetical protein
MFDKFFITAILIFNLLFISGHTFANPEFISVKENFTEIGKYEKFELTIDLNADFLNPFDPKNISLQGYFISPSGKIKIIDGFYYTDFTVTKTASLKYARGNSYWKIRFTPDETGVWTYSLQCTDTSGLTKYKGNSFKCIPSGEKGFIRKSKTNYFLFDNGEKFFGIGENMCWSGGNRIFDYKKWIDDLADNGGNFIRLWMSSWATALEWKETGLGDYSKRQDRAYDLDWIIDYAAAKGVYIMLCLNNHGAVSTYVNPEWNDNPYNIKNGGPCRTTEDFYTDSIAIKFYLRKLRYINARWGYSPNIFCWEIFNEIEWADFYQQNRDKIIRWQKLNAEYLKCVDVNNHLRTTSYANYEHDPKLWEQPEIDFTQTHFYSNSSDFESIQVEAIREYLNNFDKPTIIGEFGLASRRQSPMQMDPKGITFHNSIWASALCGAYGTSMMWWWDYYLHPFGLYRFYKPLSDFITNINYTNEDYRPFNEITFECDGLSDLLITPLVSGWLKAPVSNFIIDSTGLVPSEKKFSGILFSKEFWNLGRRNPPTFEVNFKEPHAFKVVIGDTSYNSRINIKLDGIEKVDELAFRDSSYFIEVPAGIHKITLDNSGEGRIRISHIEISDYSNALNGFASIGKNSIIGWLHNKNYNWKYVKENGIPCKISGKVKLGAIKNGKYFVEITDCNSGNIIDSFTRTVDNNELQFEIKNLEWDYAFKAQCIGELKGRPDIPAFEVCESEPKIFSLNTESFGLRINKPSKIEITVENYLGQKVKSISGGFYSLGIHNVNCNLEKLLPGMYFIKFTSPECNRRIKYFLLN